MEAPSFVSKARTAFHSAAAKAERVLSDFKPDRDSDKHLQSGGSANRAEDESSKNQTENETKSNHESNKHSRWNPASSKTKQEWQDRFKNIRIGRKVVEDTDKGESTSGTSAKGENRRMSFPVYDDNLYLLNMSNDLEAKAESARLSPDGLSPSDAEKIPPTHVLKQLAVAIESGKKHKSVKDLIMSRGDSSPVRERAALSLSAVKSLVLREKDENGDDEKDASLLQSLFNSEGNFLRRKVGSDSAALATMSSLPRDIHGSPPESFVVKLSEVIGSFKTQRRMALFWFKVVAEFGRLWSEEQHLPGIPLDTIPDLNCCLLYQQLQVVNCCVSRKRRRAAATEALEFVIRESSSNSKDLGCSRGAGPASHISYARINCGESVLRLGADCQTDLTMLETGEPLYSPVTQEEPLLTEDLIKETEEFVLRTGSMGAGCSQLLSDMQAFKAANPGCILEDFVRWHSPPDWTEAESTSKIKESSDDSDSATRGQLSSRMQKEGNLWIELWETAKPIPAVKQTPLFDEDLAVEGILLMLEDIPPSQLFEQLFVSLFGLGIVMAEAALSTDSNLSKLFYECKDYVIVAFQGSTWVDKIDDLCQVYETVEKMLIDPEEVIKMTKQPETPTSEGDTKNRFRRLILNFGKDREAKKQASKVQGALESPSPASSTRQAFANFFDGKSSLFSKRPPKSEGSSPAEKRSSDDSEWMIV